LDEWLDECADFPSAAHDDIVDVLAYAARVAITTFMPVGVATAPRRSSDDLDLSEASTPW
jgi:hypothetical protein